MAEKQETLEALKQAYDALQKWHGKLGSAHKEKWDNPYSAFQPRCPYCLTIGLLYESIGAMENETNER